MFTGFTVTMPEVRFPQLSVAVAPASVYVAFWQSSTEASPLRVMTGFSLSSTVTGNVHTPELFAKSFAVNVWEFVPFGKA